MISLWAKQHWLKQLIDSCLLAGIAVADLPTLSAKVKQQLLTALHQRATPLPKGLPAQLTTPLTATCWASNSWQDMPGGGGSADAHCYNKPKGQAAAAAAAAQVFDLLVADGTVHEGRCHSSSRSHASCSVNL
jgi:hypothetical protein